MIRAQLLAVTLVLFAVGCGSSEKGGFGHDAVHNDVGGTHEDTPSDPQAYAIACTQVDQALQYHDTAQRTPMLAAVRKLNEHPKTTAESFFLGAAAVVIEAEGISNHDYSPQNKVTVINGCKMTGHVLKHLA